MSVSELAIGALIGVLTSSIASIIFVYYLSQIRPEIEISPIICKTTIFNHSSIHGHSNPAYVIKIINWTKSRLTNVKIRLYVANEITLNDGTKLFDKIELKLESQPLVIEAFIGDRKEENERKRRTKSNKFILRKIADSLFWFILNRISMDHIEDPSYKLKAKQWAVWIRTFDNLDEIWNESGQSFLYFAIYAEHSFSGFGKVFTKEFNPKRSTLLEGDFESGVGLQRDTKEIKRASERQI